MTQFDTVNLDIYSAEEIRLAEQLFNDHYEELRLIARHKRRRSVPITLETYDILHEGFLKLQGHTIWKTRDHFLASATLAIRNVIIDYARRKQTVKRKSEGNVPIEDGLMPEFGETPEQILIMSDLITRLEQENPRWMRVLDARYFSGFTEDETAKLLDVSSRTIRRDWKEAKGWLAEQMIPDAAQ